MHWLCLIGSTHFFESRYKRSPLPSEKVALCMWVQGLTALSTAAVAGSVEVVDLLRSHGAAVNELLGLDHEEVKHAFP